MNGGDECGVFIKLLDVVPQSVDLSLAEIIEQEVAVKLKLVGKLSGGLKIRSVEVKPEKVKVFSPTADKKGKPMYLECIENDTVIYSKIIAPLAVHPIDKGWPDVEASITIGQ